MPMASSPPSMIRPLQHLSSRIIRLSNHYMLRRSCKTQPSTQAGRGISRSPLVSSPPTGQVGRRQGPYHFKFIACEVGKSRQKKPKKCVTTFLRSRLCFAAGYCSRIPIAGNRMRTINRYIVALARIRSELRDLPISRESCLCITQ